METSETFGATGEKREEMQEGEGASGHTPLARRSKQRKWLKFQVMHVAVPRTESGGGEVAQRAAKPTGLIGAGQDKVDSVRTSQAALKTSDSAFGPRGCGWSRCGARSSAPATLPTMTARCAWLASAGSCAVALRTCGRPNTLASLSTGRLELSRRGGIRGALAPVTSARQASPLP